MKTFLEMLGIIVLLFVLGAINLGMNNWKRNDCFEQGGRYIENTSDSTASACILGK